MNARRFPCPIPQASGAPCKYRRHEHEIVCPYHWYALPEGLRRAFWRAVKDNEDDAIAALGQEALEFLTARRAS